MNKVLMKRLSVQDIPLLSGVYKEVFAGAPWYEERICAGALSSKDKCKVQYTSRTLPDGFKWQLDGVKREGVVGSASRLSACLVCARPLIEFYPDFVDQNKLIEEATRQRGFIGYVLTEDNSPIGFSWGFGVPLVGRTTSVEFPRINPLLKDKGLNLEKTFYGAELGVVDGKRDSGFGLLASAVRINAARISEYESFVARTKNERVLSILKRVFSGSPGEKLFDDPERGTPWYAWKFKDFDKDEVLNRILPLGIEG